MSHHQLPDGLADYIANKLYARPPLREAWREACAEALVHSALHCHSPQSGWRPAPADQPWHLENDAGIQLQVKQTAAPQPAANDQNRRHPSLSFDIHPGKNGRQTDIYVFAWHPETDPDLANLRDPRQWRFCAIPEDELPDAALEQKTQRISLNRLTSLAANVGLETIPYCQLAPTINRIAKIILEIDAEDARLAEEIMEKIRRGEERVYTEAEVRQHLGLDD